MINTVAEACINNRKSSSKEDGRYKQPITVETLVKNHKDDSIAQQWGRETVTAGGSIDNSCYALHVMTEQNGDSGSQTFNLMTVNWL